MKAAPPAAMKMPCCPRCDEDELGAISMGPDGPEVFCYRCCWRPDPSELPISIRNAASSILARELRMSDQVKP